MNLLRRRKTTLKAMLNEFGITTYEGLLTRCERTGVEAPTLEQFLAACPEVVNSPAEGVLVLEPPRVISELDGNDIEPEKYEILDLDVQEDQSSVQSDEQVESTKKTRKRKVN